MPQAKVIYSKFCHGCGQNFKTVQPFKKICIKCTKNGFNRYSQNNIKDITVVQPGHHTYVRFTDGWNVCSCGVSAWWPR